MIRATFLSSILAFLTLFSPVLRGAADEANGPVVDKRAEQVLRQTASFYEKLQKFSLYMSFSAVMQAPGIRREMWAKYDIRAAKPNKIALVLEDGMGPTLVSDGKTMSIYVPPLQKFSQKEAPEDFNALFAQEEALLVNKGVGNLLLVDMLLKKNVYKALLDNVSEVKYVNEEMLDGEKTHKLSLEQPGMIMELWIQDGDEPWIRQASVDMTRPLAEAMPQMRETKMVVTVTYNEWRKNGLTEDAFVFSPPIEARKATDLFGQEEKNPLIGMPAPPMKLDRLGGGKIDLEAHKGKDVVVLEFWASWCAPCIATLPMVLDVTHHFKGKNVVFYAINQNEEPEVVDAFMKKKKLAFEVGLDNAGKLGEAFGVSGIPLTVLIGRDGKIEAIHTGLSPDLKDKLMEQIQMLVDGKSLVKKSL
ncbi:MAG TPA: DUF2092 domain-containing protein [Planctomycetota bacterium]|nr:DUF2092 domain-containing protein [Planctomycetota bacterium]